MAKEPQNENLPTSARSSGNFLSPFEDFLDPYRFFSGRDYMPALDVEETDDEYVLSADLPGMDKENISVECRDNQLRIFAAHKEESHTKRGSRRFRGSFERTVSLPQNVEFEQIKADYENGVLTIHAPKGEAAKPRKIEVNVH